MKNELNTKSLEYMAKLDNAVMRTLKVSEIRRNICQTDKGHLSLLLPFEGQAKDYHFVLDAVPVDKTTNKALLNLFNGTIYEL